MTSNWPSPPRRFRLGGWPVTAVVAVPLTALLLSAGPAEGLVAEVAPTGTVTATTTSTTTSTTDPTATTTTTGTTTTSTTDPTATTTTSTTTQATTSASVPLTTGPSTTTTGTTTGTSTADPTPSPSPTPAPATSAAPGLAGGPAAIALLGDPGSAPTYLAAGRTAGGLAPFQSLRVAVQLLNDGTDPADVAPQVEFRAVGSPSWLPAPLGSVPGVALHVTQEWVRDGAGTKPGPDSATIPTADFHLAVPAGLTPTTGHRASGVNPQPTYAVAPGTVTEQEFTVELAIDAAYGTTYELRVTNAGTEIPGVATALVAVGPAPATLVSPGQQVGADVAQGTTTTSPSYVLLSPTTSTSTTPTSTSTTPTTTKSTTYALLAPTTTTGTTSTTSATTTSTSTTSTTSTTTTVTIGPAGPGTIHDPGSSTTTGQCGVCHDTHSAQSQNLVKAPSATEQCYACHAGGVGGADVKEQYTLGQPANDPATRSYYSHDTTDPGDHTLDSANEFQGKLTRHSQCADCHDPHGAQVAKPTMTSTGWTAPGGFTKVAGVAVTNGASGTVPTYTWLDGMVQPVTAEYQLCFKCHSTFTTLPADVPGKPSQSFTDLATQLNPANASYHPIEAPGRNQTQKLADSLAGSSPYKLWNFTTNDTIRCVSCHSSNTTGTSTDPAQNAPDATLTVHASTNRGILIRPYENRVLSKAGQFYDNKGFALCLACHMETPYLNQTRPAAAEGTNFVFHGLHMAGISGEGSGGLDIDAPGAGQGNARCAECHWSSHGTTDLPSTQKVAGDRLVVFAPDVLPSKAMGGVPTFTKTATGGTCTLTCHGEDHQGATYAN